MADSGFTVHVPALHELRTRLTDLGGRAGSLSDLLAGVAADTGRPDSDRMGRLGPTDAAALAGRLRDGLHTDGGHVRDCATSYLSLDQAGAQRFGGVL
jgi:hypothetical protein